MSQRALESALYRSAGSAAGMAVAMAVILLVSVAAGLVVYFLFLAPNRPSQYKGFTGWLHRFLNFDEMLTTIIVKIAYVATAVYLVLSGLVTMFTANFLAGLLLIVLGNVAARMVYEFIIVLFSMHSNVVSINKKLKGMDAEDTRPEAPQPAAPAYVPPYEQPTQQNTYYPPQDDGTQQ